MTALDDPLEDPEVIPVGDAFRFRWPSLLLEADLGRFAEHRDTLNAELVIATMGVGADGAAVRKLFFRTSLNLLAGETRVRLGKNLSDRRPDLPWQKILEWICFVGVEKVRDGEPTVDLRTVDPDAQPTWFLRPLVEHGGPTVIFAMGGSGKSYIAMACAVTVASAHPIFGTGPATPGAVLYLDWEAYNVSHERRRRAVCRGAGINMDTVVIHHRRMTANLMESVATIQREIMRLGIVFVIVDSLAAARGGEPESSDVTTRLFGAVRALNIPLLCIDHVTKEQIRRTAEEGGRLSPFGSIMTENRCRNTFSLHAEQEEGSNDLDMILKHQKTNDGPLQKPRGYRFSFENRVDAYGDERAYAVTIRPQDPAALPNFRARLSLTDQILAHMRETSDGTATADEVAPVIGKKIDVVAVRMSQMKGKGLLSYLQDRRRYGIASPRGEAS